MKCSFLSEENMLLGTDPVILDPRDFSKYMCAKFQINYDGFVNADRNNKYNVDGVFVLYYGNSAILTKSLTEVVGYRDEFIFSNIKNPDAMLTLHHFESLESAFEVASEFITEF